MKSGRCPRDGMSIPQVAEVLSGGESVRFYWCCDCAELFAFIGKSTWGTNVAFAYDGQGGWKVSRSSLSSASEPEGLAAMTAVTQVRPDPAAMPGLRVLPSQTGEVSVPPVLRSKGPFVKVAFACPACEFPARLILNQPREWQCSKCDQRLSIPVPPPELPACVVCGNHELYKKKAFPHWLRMSILVGACVASVFT